MGEELEWKLEGQNKMIAVMLSWYWQRKKTKSQKEAKAKNLIKSEFQLVIFQTL